MNEINNTGKKPTWKKLLNLFNAIKHIHKRVPISESTGGWKEAFFKKKKKTSFLEIVFVSVQLPVLERVGKVITNLQFKGAVYYRRG